MKIKNLKYSLKAISFALTLSLTGCGNQNTTKNIEQLSDVIEEAQKTVEDIESEISLNSDSETTEIIEVSLLTIEEVDQIVERIQNDSTYWTSYYDFNNELTLKNYNYAETDNRVISDNTYSDINLLLNQPIITNLFIEDANFDLSKLDISNLKKISLVNIKLENAKEIMNLATQNNIKLEYILYSDIEKSSKIINYIVENGIVCESLSLVVSSEEELLEFNKLLEKVNASSISFTLRNDEVENANIININAKLNDNTKSFGLNFDYLYEGVSIENKELGNVEVISNNPSVSIVLNDVLITENTKFLVPNNSCVFLTGNHIDANPFYDLKDASLLYYFNEDKYDSFNFTALDGNYKDVINQIENVNNQVSMSKKIK